MKNVSTIHNCYGCGVCAVSCGKKIINIRLNEDGFYAPYIDEPEKCMECGICLDVCAFNHKERALSLRRYRLNLGLHGAMMRQYVGSVQAVV